MFSAYYTLIAAGGEKLPDHWTKFLKKYHPEHLDPSEIESEQEKERRRQAEIARANAEAAAIVAMDKQRVIDLASEREARR